MTYYLVMDAWNVVVCRLEDAGAAALAARKCRGFVVTITPRKGAV